MPKSKQVDILRDPITVAESMLKEQSLMVEGVLTQGKRKRNPMRDVLPQGMTLKRFQEILANAGTE